MAKEVIRHAIVQAILSQAAVLTNILAAKPLQQKSSSNYT